MEDRLAALRTAQDAKRNRRELLSVVAARQRLETDSRGRGRAWVNGREVGGEDSRFVHLSRSHD
jgi:hypothetical protein